MGQTKLLTKSPLFDNGYFYYYLNCIVHTQTCHGYGMASAPSLLAGPQCITCVKACAVPRSITCVKAGALVSNSGPSRDTTQLMSVPFLTIIISISAVQKRLHITYVEILITRVTNIS